MLLEPLNVKVECTKKDIKTEGHLLNKYIPFQNLLIEDPGGKGNRISEFTTNNLNYSENYPVNIEIQDSFDGSVNLILNDDYNSPKMINSRFSVQEESTFIIPDHKGNKDTNLYEDKQLQQETSLYKTSNTIPELEFVGLENGGGLKCGSYHFYFKLSDNDDNETDFILESGLVTCHVGDINNPQSIRMGLVNENSEKSIVFKLSKLDTAFDFIKVYYTRTTSDETGIDVTSAYCINEKYNLSEVTQLTITGFESQIEIAMNEINPAFQYCQKVKTQAQCQNMLFFGNIWKPELDFEFLEKVSLLFIPKTEQSKENIGSLSGKYKDHSKKYGYYNAKNLYYKLGYFPEEYYRLGIVYILKDGTLSPVFNIRGYNDIDDNPNITRLTKLQTTEEGLILPIGKNYENTKGVFKTKRITPYDGNKIKPLNITITFDYNSDSDKDGTYKDEDYAIKLNELVKGFFFVRQNRIPTFYAQGLVIGKTKNDFGNIPVIKNKNKYVAESFITPTKLKNYIDSDEDPNKEFDPNLMSTVDGTVLGRNYVEVPNTNVENKSIIVPEAQVRQPIFNSLFTSADFTLETFAEPEPKTSWKLLNDKHLYISPNELCYDNDNSKNVEKLTIVPQGMKITTDGENYFSAVAGDPSWPIDVVDVKYNPKETPGSSVGNINNKLTDSPYKVRGNFGLYVGKETNIHKYGTIINIRPKDYKPENQEYCINQFTLRSNIQEPYYAISDRMELPELIMIDQDSGRLDIKNTCYRGDCYICQVTHRLHSNFIDNELTLNDNIVDSLTWYNNYAVVQKTEPVMVKGTYYVSNKPAESFYRKWHMTKDGAFSNHGTFKESPGKIEMFIDDLTGKSAWKEFGFTKINKSDLNAVPLGTWVTFTCLSNVNLEMRDTDSTIPGEVSKFNRPRGFYPLYEMNKQSSGKQPESGIINGAANVTLSERFNFIQPDIPWVKNKFDTRIMYSTVRPKGSFKNGYRVFQDQAYRDYPKTYGSLVCLKELNGNLLAVMEHGILLIPVNERAIGGQGAGGNVYINTSNVLPENPLVISDCLGSLWQDSVIKTSGYTGAPLVYGVDTVAKKIWVTDGKTLKILSDVKVQKWLNDNINFKVTDKQEKVGIKNCKTHYNQFKKDVIFTFYNKDKEWNLCFNEDLQNFTTFYSWTPLFSENIDNIYFSFNKENYGKNKYNNHLWKHGQAGNLNTELIKPTNWYGKQHSFELEFVVNQPTQCQKIFDNLLIISNKVSPEEFTYEIVGETYDWFRYKDIITWINKNFSDIEIGYKQILNKPISNILKKYPDFPKGEFENDKIFKTLPFIKREIKGFGEWEDNSTEVKLIEDSQLNEDRISTKQIGNDIKKFGRIKGNMQYLEDLWNVEIRPTNFKYAYLDKSGELKFKIFKQERIRDKYIKIRIKYSGEDLTIIQAIKTLFTLSYS